MIAEVFNLSAFQGAEATGLIDKLAVEQTSVVDRMLWMAVALILIFLAALLAYRLLAERRT